MDHVLMERAQRYRLRAEELRAVADDMRNPASHEIFRRMANDDNLLADNTEARAKFTPRRQTPTG